MNKLFFIALVTITLTSCSTLEEQRRVEFYNSAPAGFTEVITSKRLSKLKPIHIIRLLKKNCCDAVMVEPTAITHWSALDIAEVEALLGNESFTAPVASTAGTFNCRGARYMSNVDREVKHLIRAYKEKTYPISQCSTLDLMVEPVKK